ncbi:hypothetical protein J7399_14755 [Shimia sp. R9_1]|uniref:hypothetical protein n=1 Tax=Shimia sp. R9_1 TaxID=2821111 RepID=UPI001ADC2DFE|nr:hypothetical protein [Shimia sp. R9_1]MBO9408694.1 hypothetical protein [Shimia sp. R9_1]
MTSVYFILLAIVLFGIILIALTRRELFYRLHDRALLTNPVYRFSFPKSLKNQERLLSFSRFFLRSIGVIFASIGLLILGLIWVMHVSPFRGDEFEVSAWEEAGSCKGLSDLQCMEKEASCPRGGMVDDLTTSYLVPGQMTRDQVTAMLGPSTYKIKIDGIACPAYSLGMCSGLGIDYDSLFVCFGVDDRVSSTGHVQH